LVTLLLSLGVLLLLQPAARADVQMALISPPGGNVAYGVYLSPYSATVDGTLTTIVCDSFTAETYIGETWKATVLNGSAEGSSVATQYQEIGYLAQQLPGANLDQQAALSFAIWDIFADSAVKAWLHTYGADTFYTNEVLADVLDAQATKGTFNLSNLTVYTPEANSGMCGGSSCSSATPQEFVSISAPEAPAPAILAFDLLGLLGVVFFVRRRANAHAAK
jgi:hypothetical protein